VLLDRALQAEHRERVLGAHVHDPPGRAGDIAAITMLLQEGVRIGLDSVAVHVRARVALVGVADEILLGPGRLLQELPLFPGQVPRRRAAQLGGLDLLDDGGGFWSIRTLYRPDTADRDVLSMSSG